MTIVTKKRFKDNGETILSFGEEFLVICLKCQNCANVIPKFQEIKYNKYSYSKIDSVKLTCLSCGYAKLKKEVDTFYLGDYDFYFQLPLWLELKCKKDTIWAYNYKHLNFLENYILADIKEQDNTFNKSYISRLPKWIKKTTNKEKILNAIKKLKNK